MQAIRMARRISMYDYLYKGMIISEMKSLIENNSVFCVHKHHGLGKSEDCLFEMKKLNRLF